jgi:putative nucleotidyltransferase-like protein
MVNATRRPGVGDDAQTLTPEESLLLLTSRPFLALTDTQRLPVIVEAIRDWAYLLWRAEQYRMLPLLKHHLIASGTFARIPQEIQTYVERWTALSRARSVEQVRQIGRIVGALQESRIDYLMLKGCSLSLFYYPDWALRPMQDLDIIVRPHDAVRIQRLLFRLGYRHGIWDSDSATFTPTSVRLTPQAIRSHIELPPFTHLARARSPLAASDVLDSWRRQHIKCAIDRHGWLTVPVFVDVHTNVSEGFDLIDVWRGAETHTVADIPVRTQSTTGMLWFIAARLYLEAFTYNTLKLSMFGDVHTVLYRAANRVDWAELLATCYKYGMRPALYYVLAQVRRLTGIDVPLEVLAILRPDPHEIPLDNDWGDIMPKLLSRPSLSALTYYATPRRSSM